ncbi:TPR repeat-containing protein [Gloeobacter kilaueensis]|uniref:TPR repeat-containing protein n=1 Tax=Gloeobacter kilaueensis (strain ATCC BAA-2537 / CCAP 1431/1 / ULC 316 / JS1) TaxID=1183438 RepID=U5QNC1_GLOK1|nr:TPR repeat-containing protein [Gloeobacter kilaueensis]AGY59104.1 TPR repeat-containing protein [Gloeobacter kilaueensis JS1]
METKDNLQLLIETAARKHHLGDIPGALDEYNRAIEREPDDPFLYGSRGFFYLAARQRAAAKVDFARALELLQPLLQTEEAQVPPRHPFSRVRVSHRMLKNALANLR